MGGVHSTVGWPGSSGQGDAHRPIEQRAYILGILSGFSTFLASQSSFLAKYPGWSWVVLACPGSSWVVLAGTSRATPPFSRPSAHGLCGYIGHPGSSNKTQWSLGNSPPTHTQGPQMATLARLLPVLGTDHAHLRMHQRICTVPYVRPAYPYPPYWRPPPSFLALFFFYLQFQHAIDKLYCVHCPRSGHVCLRKHTVPIKIFLVVSPHCRTGATQSIFPAACPLKSQPQKDFSVVHLPSTLPIYASSHLGFHVPEEFCPFTTGFLFIFIFVAWGPIGLYNGLVIKFCLLPRCILPSSSFLVAGTRSLVVLDAQSFSSRRSLHSYFSATKEKTATRTWLNKLSLTWLRDSSPSRASPDPIAHLSPPPSSTPPKTLGSRSCGSVSSTLVHR